jgi:peptidoglycan/xylan/chitin deacetylase (PgdA/CDA1 family)
VGGAGSGGGGATGASGSGGSGGVHVCAPVSPLGTDLGTLQVESVSTWKGNAKGAYTIIHDDVCDYTIDSLFDIAEPELSARNLPSAFGAIVSRCEERKLWAKLEVMRQHGHEIINHTWDHKDMVEDSQALYAIEIDQATQVLDANLQGQRTSFFIFPYDSFNDSAVEHLDAQGYLGARAGSKGVNTADFPDGLRVMFDVYGGENSIYDGQGDILKIYVDLAISEGGWSVREFHGIADNTFWAMETEAYKAHLDYVKSKVDAGELWVDTPSEVVRYRFTRQYCSLPPVVGSNLVPGMPSPDCAKYGTKVSTVITTSVDAPSILAKQDGQMLATKRLAANRYLVDLNPAGCPVALGGGP